MNFISDLGTKVEDDIKFTNSGGIFECDFGNKQLVAYGKMSKLLFEVETEFDEEPFDDKIIISSKVFYWNEKYKNIYKK